MFLDGIQCLMVMKLHVVPRRWTFYLLLVQWWLLYFEYEYDTECDMVSNGRRPVERTRQLLYPPRSVRVDGAFVMRCVPCIEFWAADGSQKTKTAIVETNKFKVQFLLGFCTDIKMLYKKWVRLTPFRFVCRILIHEACKYTMKRNLSLISFNCFLSIDPDSCGLKLSIDKICCRATSETTWMLVAAIGRACFML
jgi:hypothetical protein